MYTLILITIQWSFVYGDSISYEKNAKMFGTKIVGYWMLEQHQTNNYRSKEFTKQKNIFLFIEKNVSICYKKRIEIEVVPHSYMIDMRDKNNIWIMNLAKFIGGI